MYLVVQNGGEFIRREIRICRLPRSDWRRSVLKSNDEQGQCIMTWTLEVRRLTRERSRCVLSFCEWSGGRVARSRVAEGNYNMLRLQRSRVRVLFSFLTILQLSEFAALTPVAQPLLCIPSRSVLIAHPMSHARK